MCYSWYLLLVQCLPFPVLGTVYLSWFPCDSAPLHPCNNVLLVPAHLHLGHLVLGSKRLISTEPPAGFGQWEIAEKYQRARGWRLALLPGHLHPLIPPCFPLTLSCLSLMLAMAPFFHKRPKFLLSISPGFATASSPCLFMSELLFGIDSHGMLHKPLLNFTSPSQWLARVLIRLHVIIHMWMGRTISVSSRTVNPSSRQQHKFLSWSLRLPCHFIHFLTTDILLITQGPLWLLLYSFTFSCFWKSELLVPGSPLY